MRNAKVQTRLERFLGWVQDHRVFSAVVIIGVVVIAFAQFLTSVDEIRRTVTEWRRGGSQPLHGVSEPYKAPWQGASLVNSTNEPISYLIWDYKISLWGVSTILPGEKHVFTEKSAYVFLRFQDGTENYYRLASQAFAQPPTKDELEQVEPNYVLGVRTGEDEVWWQLYCNGEEIGPLAPVTRQGALAYRFDYP